MKSNYETKVAIGAIVATIVGALFIASAWTAEMGVSGKLFMTAIVIALWAAAVAMIIEYIPKR